MRHLFFFTGIIVACIVATCQEPLTNDTVVKLVKAGLSEDVIVNMITSQPGRYTATVTDVLALKKLGVPDKVMAAMIKKTGIEGSNQLQPQKTATVPNGLPSEIGVYAKKGDAWTELLPEVVNWKTGGVLKHVASAGIVKGDINGVLNGLNSRNAIKSPVEILVCTPEGSAITEYQLIQLHANKDHREFRTVTGGILHESGGTTRDLLAFEGKKIASRMYSVVLPTISPGEYGFLPPGALPSGGTHASLGKMYTFRLVE